MRWTFTTDQFPEVSSWGAHTYLREEADFEDVFDWMENFVADVATTVVQPCHLSRVSVAGWSVGPGFTGYHQVGARDINLAYGSGNPAPHQLQWVIGYRNTSEPSFALGRRRNRFYLGPIKVSVIGTDSRLTTGIQGSLGSTMVTQNSELAAIPVAAGNEAFAGLSPVSRAEGLMFNTDQFSFGRKFDVIRSRAEHVPEEPLYIAPE